MNIKGQGHFLTLAHGHVHIKLKLTFFSETTEPFSIKFCMLAEMKIYRYDVGHMTKMAVMSIYEQNPLKKVIEKQ